MKLDRDAQAFLTAMAVAGKTDLKGVDPVIAREQVQRSYMRMKIRVATVEKVQNIAFNGPEGNIPLRIYTPGQCQQYPVILFFHGGGWVFYDLDAYDPLCSHLCQTSECMVVSVGYRLAPEHKFPAATDDALAAVRWASTHIGEYGGDPDTLFMAGDSAGGNLAAVTALRLRDEGGPAITGQVLIYPVTDYIEPEKPSLQQFADGYSLTSEALYWFWDQYLVNNADRNHPWVAPVKAPNLAGLPPTLVVTAGFDPLRDDGTLYAELLKQRGNLVKLLHYPSMIHGFMSFPGFIKKTALALEDISLWIRELLKADKQYKDF